MRIEGMGVVGGGKVHNSTCNYGQQQPAGPGDMSPQAQLVGEERLVFGNGVMDMVWTWFGKQRSTGPRFESQPLIQ